MTLKIKDAVKLMLPYWSKMILIMLLAIIIAVISAVTPFISQAMIDRGIMQGDIQTVIYFAFAIIILQIGSSGIEYVQQLQEINISNDLGKRLKMQAFEHGLKLKPHYYKDRGFMQLMSDAIYYISSIMSIASSSFMTILVVIFKCLGASIGLFILDWRLALFVMAMMPVKVAINIFMKKRAEKFGKMLMDVNKDFNLWYANIIQGVTDIKLFNLEKRFSTEYGKHTECINEASKRQSLMTKQNNMISQALETVLSYSLYIIGAVLIAGGNLTFGGLVAFITFTTYVLLPVNILFSLSIILKQITPCVEGLKAFNELEEENYSSDKTIAGKIETIEFKDVTAAFGEREVLKNVNLKISKGEKVAVVGENGSGKSTLMNLLLRFNEPSRGEILINGEPIESYNIVDYRERFGVVTQGVHLFKGTITDNITFGNNDDIRSLEKDGLAFCTEVVHKLEKETDVGTEGTKLSGGERQKIALLRAVERNASVLILDEPTSNYDMESCGRFNEFLKHDNTYDYYFVVTHDKEVLECVDKIIKVENGCVSISDVRKDED